MELIVKISSQYSGCLVSSKLPCSDKRLISQLNAGEFGDCNKEGLKDMMNNYTTKSQQFVNEQQS